MNKIKKIFRYILGGFIAFIFNQVGASAQNQLGGDVQALYGISAQPLPEAIFFRILSPLIIGMVAILAFIAGVIIFIKRKK